jgi:hypothetical protein
MDVAVLLAMVALGFRHGFDWHHIAAITDITSTTSSSHADVGVPFGGPVSGGVTATGFIGAQRLRTIYVVFGLVAGALSLYVGLLFVFGLGTALPDLQQLLFGTEPD